MMMLLLLLLLLGSSSCCCCCGALIVMLMVIYGRYLSVRGLELEGLTWKNEWACLLVLFFFSLFREEKIIRLSAPTKHPK